MSTVESIRQKRRKGMSISQICREEKVDFKTAVMSGMNSKTGGLYIPTSYPKIASSYLSNSTDPSFRELAFEMAKPYVQGW